MQTTLHTADELSAAFWAGRNDAHYDGRKAVNRYSDPTLMAQWKRGARQVFAEDALSADTEWDSDAGYGEG